MNGVLFGCGHVKAEYEYVIWFEESSNKKMKSMKKCCYPFFLAST